MAASEIMASRVNCFAFVHNVRVRQGSSANNFDAIRLAAAAVVLGSHQFALMGRPEPRPFGLLTLGSFGVLVFFSISGYLVAQSWERDPHPWRFAAKRLLRVWPGLLLVTLLAALLVGPLCSSLRLADYFGATLTWHYFSQLYLDIQHQLPGVFLHHPWPVVNGSLWTIPIEMRWYGILLLAGSAGLLQPRMRYPLALATALYAIYVFGIFDVQHNPRASFWQPDFGIEYGCYFCYGVALNQLREHWRGRDPLVFAVLAVLAALLVALDHGYAALFVLLPWLLIRLAEASTPVLRRCGRFGDFSYGLYIYGFICQQVVLSWIGFAGSYGWALTLSTCLTLACAVLSWHLVERPGLALKRRLPRTSEAMRGHARELA